MKYNYVPGLIVLHSFSMQFKSAMRNTPPEPANFFHSF